VVERATEVCCGRDGQRCRWRSGRRKLENDHHSILNLFSDRASTYLFELLTQAVPTWEDAVYPWPFSRGIKQTPREHECQRRGIFDVGDHMQTAASHADHYGWKNAPGSMAHQWAHEWRAAQ
jgi:hypothetical protein